MNNTVNPKLKSDRFTGGVTLGYNYQKNKFFVGGEVDFGANGINKSEKVAGNFGNGNGNFSFTHNVKSRWLLTARPRAGVAIKKVLFYGTAGVAVTDIDYDGLFTAAVLFTRTERGSFKKNKAGWTAGGGIEIKVNNHFSVKGEYLLSQFGRTSVTTNNLGGLDLAGKPTTTPDEFFTRSTDLKSHSIRFGINYRFL